MNMRITFAIAAVLNICVGCEQKTPPAREQSATAVESPTPQVKHAHFTDVSRETGIPREFIITSGSIPSTEILEVKGSGIGLIDFDNDDDLDLFVANGATMDDPENGPGCRLFENVGGLRFHDATSRAQIKINRWATGVAVGDYDGDGLDDLFIACYGPNILLRNQGDGTFRDVTAQAFETSTAQGDARQWSTSAAFGDLDNDGDLDLYVCRYLHFDLRNRPPRSRFKDAEVMGGPHGLAPLPDSVWENLGDGRLREVSEASGIGKARPSFGLNVVILDFDNDGWQDIAVANDSMPDFFFHNRTNASGKMAFVEIGIASGIAANADGSNQASMGLAIADVDGNGLADKFTTVFSSDVNALHLNQSTPDNLFFEDRAQQFGLSLISRPYLSWSAGFFDFDLDGDEDLCFVNGHVYPQATRGRMDSDYEQPPLLFEREGNRFQRVTAEIGGEWLAEAHRDRSAVFADLDDDGDIDVVIGEMNGPVRVLRNDCTRGDWLIVELEDARPASKNRRGLGGKIELISGSSTQRRWLFTGGGYLSSGAPYVHFGFPGRSDGKCTVTVTWPDGYEQTVENVARNQRATVIRN